MINVFLCITQLGFCCVYFVFVAANLHDVIKHYFFDISVHWYLVILLVPMVFLNFVKSLKYLTPASLFASILTCSGLIITFFYMLQDLPNTSTVQAFSSWSQLPLYFGTAIYAFEGIGVVSTFFLLIYFSSHITKLETMSEKQFYRTIPPKNFTPTKNRNN